MQFLIIVRIIIIFQLKIETSLVFRENYTEKKRKKGNTGNALSGFTTKA